MTARRAFMAATLAALVLGLACLERPAGAADLGPVPAIAAPAATPPSPSAWQFDFRPYGWTFFINGTNTLGPATIDVDTNVFRIIEESNQLYAWMSYQELRRDRLGLFADLFWARFNVDEDTVRRRQLIAGLDVSVVADANIWLDVVIAEPGFAYQIASWSAGASNDPAFSATTAIDLVGGARYWSATTDIDLSVTAAIDIPALNLSGTGSVSGQKTIDWWDPYVGFRLRQGFAPGQELMLRADIGGFGVGSQFSWQAAAGYGFQADFHGHRLNGYLGYRALYVDYQQDSGGLRFGLETLLHGPIVGLTFRW